MKASRGGSEKMGKMRERSVHKGCTSRETRDNNDNDANNNNNNNNDDDGDDDDDNNNINNSINISHQPSATLRQPSPTPQEPHDHIVSHITDAVEMVNQ